MGLLLERDRQLSSSLEKLNHLAELLEQQYEESEDEEVLQKFCTVKSDLGRVSLGLGDFEGAIENSSTALDLSQEIEGLEKPRLSSQITVGLGYYFLGQLEDAIDVFQTVLAESNEDVDVMLLVARSLWAVGGDKERQVAIDQIRDWYGLQSPWADISLIKEPQHVVSLASLGTFGVLKHDKDAMGQSETALRNAKVIAKDGVNIRKLLMAISRIQGRNTDDVARASIMTDPSSAREWANLSHGGDATAQLAVKLAQHDHTIDTDELSALYEKSGSMGDIQSGVLLSPWRIEGWQKLRSISQS